MIVRKSGRDNTEIETHYLLWENNRFRELRRVIESGSPTP